MGCDVMIDTNNLFSFSCSIFQQSNVNFASALINRCRERFAKAKVKNIT